MNKLELFDSHAHLDDKKLVQDTAGVLDRAAKAGVKYIATIGCDYRSSLFAVHLAEKYPERLVATVGFHPSDCDKYTDDMPEKLAELASAPAARAIGEIGLDYYWDNVPRDIQRKVFIEQINLAKSLHKPICIHDREAHGDVFNICKSEKAAEFGGVMHCFSGSWELAKAAMDMGFYLSFGGPVTFKNAKHSVDIVKKMPLDFLMLETDSPYLSPEPYRGKLNEPANVYFVAQRIADLRGVSVEEIAEITTRNAKKFYGI